MKAIPLSPPGRAATRGMLEIYLQVLPDLMLFPTKRPSPDKTPRTPFLENPVRC